MSFLQSIILAIVEGITEFLPVSSTGHMIIASSVMGIAEDPFVKTFTVTIQFGAILSVVVLYWKRFFRSVDFYLKLFAAFIPSAVFGILLGDLIDAMLENVLVVAISLVIGGIIFLFIDKWFSHHEEGKRITYRMALSIGLFQVISMIPGVSRSAATIIGGLSQKLTRKAAAEFSFFLAVPTMFAATCKKLYDFYQLGHGFTKSDIDVLLVGNIVAFVVAMIAIKGFVGFLTKHGFKIFGYYRIAVGGAILILLAMGVELKMV